mmetsp:Transcript_136627/g.272496  ORF Transcript_136627/g.272496 Transcript_136627/m.272496 type:complete len:219 (-) Transcript_136627:574-1230(-)
MPVQATACSRVAGARGSSWRHMVVCRIGRHRSASVVSHGGHPLQQQQQPGCRQHPRSQPHWNQLQHGLWRQMMPRLLDTKQHLVDIIQHLVKSWCSHAFGQMSCTRRSICRARGAPLQTARHNAKLGASGHQVAHALPGGQMVAVICRSITQQNIMLWGQSQDPHRAVMRRSWLICLVMGIRAEVQLNNFPAMVCKTVVLGWRTMSSSSAPSMANACM